jgi:cytochrome c-type biogenesis protein CcmH/NrfG
MDPKDLDSKIDLGVAYVQDGRDPMKGVGMLKEVEAADSNNVNVQMALGEFSVQSGQLDKAIQRFQKALRIKPEYYALWLQLAEVYGMQNNKEKQIECLKKYVSLEQDPELRHEIEEKIAQLTQTN